MHVPSPCVRNCCLNEQDVCMGCGRKLEEIIRWGDADDKERLEILERSQQRVQEMRKRWPHDNGA